MVVKLNTKAGGGTIKFRKPDGAQLNAPAPAGGESLFRFILFANIVQTLPMDVY